MPDGVQVCSRGAAEHTDQQQLVAAVAAAGAANCVIGTFLMRDLLGMPWLTWLLPVVCSLGTLMLFGMMLEIPRMKRVREVGNRGGGAPGGNMRWPTWQLSVVCSLGALMLFGMMLEVPRMKGVREVRNSTGGGGDEHALAKMVGVTTLGSHAGRLDGGSSELCGAHEKGQTGNTS